MEQYREFGLLVGCWVKIDFTRTNQVEQQSRRQMTLGGTRTSSVFVFMGICFCFCSGFVFFILVIFVGMWMALGSKGEVCRCFCVYLSILFDLDLVFMSFLLL